MGDLEIRPHSDGVLHIMHGGIKKTVIIKDWDLAYIEPLIPITNVPHIVIDYDQDININIVRLSEKEVEDMKCAFRIRQKKLDK